MKKSQLRIFLLTGTAFLAIGSAVAFQRRDELPTNEGKQLRGPPSTKYRALGADAYRREWRPAAAFASRPESAPQEQSSDGGDMEERLRAGDRLRDKALMTQKEKEEFHDLLSDPDAIKHMTEILISDRPDELTSEDQRRRMDAVALLSDALRWKDNPIRKEVLAACKSVIMSDSYHQIKDEYARKSVASDRFELYLALDSSMPEEAARLLKESEGSPSAGLIAYSAKIARTVNAHRN